MIKGIVLKIKGKEVELTIEEAKILFNDLKELFGDKHDYTQPSTPIAPSGPWYTELKTKTTD